MSYEIIEKNEYGVLVKNTTNQLDCTICKFEPIDLNICIDYCGGGSNKYYLTDQEAAKLETETDSQKELLDLQIENKQLKDKIKELESEKTTELIHRRGDITHDYWYYCQECLQDLETDNHNFCPNCGRKIVK